MGNAVGIESMISYEDDMARLKDETLSKQEVDRLLGPSLSNAKLYDLVKDPATGEVSTAELRAILKTLRSNAEIRRNAEIVKKHGVGSKAKEEIVKDLQAKEQEIQSIKAQRTAFEASLVESSNKSTRAPTEAAVRENIERMAELKRTEEALAKEQLQQKRHLAGLRKQEAAVRAKQREEKEESIMAQMMGKTAFSFNEGRSGGGGGGGGEVKTALQGFEPRVSQERVFAKTRAQRDREEWEKETQMMATMEKTR